MPLFALDGVFARQTACPVRLLEPKRPDLEQGQHRDRTGTEQGRFGPITNAALRRRPRMLSRTPAYHWVRAVVSANRMYALTHRAQPHNQFNVLRAE
jgi:hypothetical protein